MNKGFSIEVVDTPTFLFDGEKVVDSNDSNINCKNILTQSVMKKHFNDFIQNCIKDSKRVFIYKIENDVVRCCSINQND